MAARLELTSFWYRPHCFHCVNQVVLMLTSWHLHEKRREVCIKARWPPASLASIARQLSTQLYFGLFGAFWYQIWKKKLKKNFAFGFMAEKFGKFGLKALFVSCAFIVRVAEALEARMKISVDVAVTINQCSLRKSTSKAQAFKTIKFSISAV